MESDPFKSDRLVYRAVEESDDDFIYSLQRDTFARANSGIAVLKPAGKKRSKDTIGYLTEKTLLAVIICIPNSTTDSEEPDIGIQIEKQHQSLGYGTEAIHWVTHWGFMMAGMHRIAIGTASYNIGAAKLYERIGFVPEGRRREAIWFNGKFHDMLDFSILRHEWDARKDSP
ncbi:acyl-CoA N-acyltransferase [Saccharata proteae CBS 121410]|uniref:Acyl-CoA N-acyltransferase n=1 Tax=Saccharata proteae CBS 121410 TaxID=1314787 RepID=A0A9P4LYM5_9PEZI|nr:acyl-CoA N-acyltransferase [Saccharata proteae CBS 121410]